MIIVSLSLSLSLSLSIYLSIYLSIRVYDSVFTIKCFKTNTFVVKNNSSSYTNLPRKINVRLSIYMSTGLGWVRLIHLGFMTYQPL